jgi:hypothetical protein
MAYKGRGAGEGRGDGVRVSREARYLDTEREHLRIKKRKAAKTLVKAQVYTALLGCGRDREALEYLDCGAYFRKFRSRCGTVVLQPCHCDHALCPDCSRERSFPLQRKVFELTRAKDKSYKFLTFTRVNVSAIDRIYVQSLAKQFAKLRRVSVWKHWISGGVFSIETTYNTAAESWHVHLHAIVEVSQPVGTKGHGRPWLPDEWIFQIQQEWLRITGDSHVVNLEPVNRGAIKELVKYQAKASTFAFSPELVDEYLKAFRGVRRIQTFGTFMGKAEPETVAEIQKGQMSLWKCFCGNCVGFGKGRGWERCGKVHRLETMLVDGRSVLKPCESPPDELEFSLTEKEFQSKAQQRLSFTAYVGAFGSELQSDLGF